MGGAVTVGPAVAQIGFWALLLLGVVIGEVNRRTAAIFVLLWLGACILLPRIAWWTGPLVTVWVAILDIILVFVVFKGDVRLR